MKPIEYTYTRRRLFPGYDGKLCKIYPIPAYDGQGTLLLTYQMLLLTGSDVVYGQYITVSKDGGETFGEHVLQTALADTYENGIRTTYFGIPFFNKKHRCWFALGRTTHYQNDTMPVLYQGKFGFTEPLQIELDAASGRFTGYRPLDFPVKGAFSVTPMPQLVELENGEMLIPFYIATEECPQLRCITLRYALQNGNPVCTAVGEPVSEDSLNRGIGEPSLAHLNGKFYMTVRSDEMGMWTDSDDGLHFGKPRPWTWDDGSILENYNTQQHWMRHKDGLFLTYTRRGAHNDHVFRHRAPIFMARFDEDRGCLLRDTEIILVPELGARLGNYNVIEATERESWLFTAEWMQPAGCEKYGSDNAFWFSKVHWKE